MITNTTWDQADIHMLVHMRNTGSSVTQIAEELGRSCSSVKMFISRHGEALGLKPRIDFKAPAKSYRPQWDKEWHGCVPFGHWTITKPWGKAA